MRPAWGQHHGISAEIHIQGVKHLSAEVLAAFLPPTIDSAYSEAALEQSLKALSQFYASMGYPFADITISSITSVDSSRLKIAIIITEGKAARLDSIIIAGTTQTDATIIEREFYLPDHPIATKAFLSESVERLRHLGIFSTVSDASLFPISDSSVGVLLSIDELHSTEIDGVLGYNPPPIPGSQGYLNGFLDLGFLNIGGSARQAIFHYSKLTQTSSELRASYKEPWLFSVPLDGMLAIARYSDDSLYTSTNLSVAFSLHTSSPLIIGAGTELLFVTPGAQRIVESSSALSVGIFCSYDKRDDPIVLRNGFTISLKALYGSKSITDSLGFSRSVPIRHLDASIEAATSILLPSLIGDAIITTQQVSSSLLELSDLFRLGGIHSLRGYSENSFYSDEYITARMELRYLVERHSYIGLFCDIGYVHQPLSLLGSTVVSTTYPIGFGLAFLFDSPIGFIQIAVAAPKQGSLDRSLLHFGLKTAI